MNLKCDGASYDIFAIYMEHERSMFKSNVDGLSPLFAKDLYYANSGDYWNGKWEYLSKLPDGNYIYHYEGVVIGKTRSTGDSIMVVDGMVASPRRLVNGMEKH